MSMSRSAAESVLDDICRGLADDVFLADQARRLLEELDGVIEAINRTGIGKQFFANLQIILQHELILSVTRMYEPYSSRSPGRTLAAATHHIAANAAKLPVLNRASLVEYLTSRGESRQTIEHLSDEGLSLTLARRLGTYIPRPDASSARPLDKALDQLKLVRDKAIAHHDRVNHSSLLIPGWSHLVPLSAGADNLEELEAADPSQPYLSREEWGRLSASARNQLALDRYVARPKSDWEIGRYYERYLGSLRETDGGW
jgi:hypothetical protein